MVTHPDWRWGISNAGSTDVLLWLEPWADEVKVPCGATATLRVLNASARSNQLNVEDNGEHVVIWATSGDCVEVYVNGVLRHTGSASIPVPEGFGTSTKNLLGIMFDNQPKARLAGRQTIIEVPSLWRRAMRWIGF